MDLDAARLLTTTKADRYGFSKNEEGSRLGVCE
jgi:hypothetical protein